MGRPAAVQEFWQRLKSLKLQCFLSVDDILYASPLHQLSSDATQEDPITHELVPNDEMIFFKTDLLQDGKVALLQYTIRHDAPSHCLSMSEDTRGA